MSRRPTTFDEYVGQDNAKTQLRIYQAGAKKRDEALAHTILYGPPGLGKTTLANIIANEQGGELYVVNARAVTSIYDIGAYFEKLNDEGRKGPGCGGKDVIFIDEIHALPTKVEEALYEVMEDFTITAEVKLIDEDTGKQVGTEVKQMYLPRFTLIGATTNLGGISRPMRDRFGIQIELQPYSVEDLARIVRRASAMPVDVEAAVDIAARSRGTARIAINFLKRCEDVALALDKEAIATETTKKAFEIMGVDILGLKTIDLRYLQVLSDGKPRGASAIALALNEQVNTVEEAIEPYLISLGFVERTTKGRVITSEGLAYIQQ